MCRKDRKLTVNGVPSSSAVVPGAVQAGRAVTAAVTAPANRDLLADATTPSKPDGSLDRRPEPNEVAVASPMTPSTERLVLPAGRTGRTSSEEPQDAHRQALSQVKDHVAQTLHETVMQTLAATIYLAESPDTSRQDLVEYIRQATHELRCVIDDLAVPEAGG